jgi:hypothetical protein
MRRPVDGRPARLTALVLRQAGRAKRRFPSPWSVEETDACFIVRDAKVQALAYVYFEDELGRRAARNSSRATTRGASPPTSRSCRCRCADMSDAGPESHRLLRVSRFQFIQDDGLVTNQRPRPRPWWRRLTELSLACAARHRHSGTRD